MSLSVELRQTAFLLGALLACLSPSVFAQEPALLPSPTEEIRVRLDTLTLLDDGDVHIEGFTDAPAEPLVLPDVDSSRAQFVTIYDSRAVGDDENLSILVIPDSAGETLYVDRNNDENLTNDGPPIFFTKQDPEVVFWLTAPDDTAQRTAQILQRMPRSVRESPERRAWFEGMHDEEGNLKPMFAALAETEGKQGTFYFDDRVALRRGRVRLGNTEIDVGLFDYNANRRFDEEEDRLLLDLDGDQRLRFREDSLVFKLDDVFAINEKRYRLTYVDPYGRGFYMVEVEEEPTQQHLEEVREWMARAQVPVRKEGVLDSMFWRMDLQTVSGDSLHLEDFKGQYILLNVWGEWCGPCVAEIPALVAVHAEIPPTQFSVIGLLQTVDLEAAWAVLERHGAVWPQVELTAALREQFGIQSYPTNLLILPDGETYLEAGMINEAFIREHVKATR